MLSYAGGELTSVQYESNKQYGTIFKGLLYSTELDCEKVDSRSVESPTGNRRLDSSELEYEH